MAANDYNIKYLADCRGINASTTDELIADNELAYGTQNVMPCQSGGRNLVKRYGIKQYGTTNTATGYIRSIYYGAAGSYYTDHSTSFLIRGVADGAVLSTIATASSRKPVWSSFATYDVVVADCNIAAKSSNGTSFTALANIPAGAYLIESYNRYLFAAGHSKGSLRWYAIGDPETWSAVNEYIFDNYIYNLKKDGNNLIVFFSDHFRVLNGFGPTFQVIDTNWNVGGGYSAIWTPYGLFFWGTSNGINWIKGSYTDIDNPLQRKYPELCNSIKYAFTDTCSSYFPIEKCVRFWCYDDGAADAGVRIDYYPEKDAIYYHTGKACDMLSVGNTGGLCVTGGKPSKGTNKIYYETVPGTIGTGSDDGTTINTTINLKRMGTGEATTVKNVRTIMPQIELSTLTTVTGAITYKAFSDNNSGSSNARSFTITPAAVGIIEEKYGVNLTCRKIQHQLTDNIVGAHVYYNLLTESGRLEHQ